MIELAPHTAVMIYLGLTILAMLSIWLTSHFRLRKKNVVISKQKLVACEYCSQVYLSAIEKRVSKCPVCSSFNESEDVAK